MDCYICFTHLFISMFLSVSWLLSVGNCLLVKVVDCALVYIFRAIFDI